MSDVDSRRKQVGQTDAMQHLVADAVHDSERNVGPVLGRINMHPERTLAEWRLDNLGDRLSHGAGIGALRHDLSEGLLDLLAEIRIRTGIVFGDAGGVRRLAGMRKDWCPW
jgi:hypothetical protein